MKNQENNENFGGISLGHHWIVSDRGGEKVLVEFSKLFPYAPIYTLVHNPDVSRILLPKQHIIPSPLQMLPKAAKAYKAYLPLHPLASALLKADARSRVILTSDAAIVKGIKLPKETIHICYCHSPPRYLWEMQDVYLKTAGTGKVGRMAFRAVSPYVRGFDWRAAQRVHHFIANSKFIAARIERCYRRSASVIYPPVAYNDFKYATDKMGFYLIVSELTPYKRIDLAVKAFNESGRQLIVIGDGSERRHLQKIANGNITFLGRQPFEVLKGHYSECRALIFPGIEDFGITPLEAQASGSPVIAYGEGGALETVVEEETGLFFHKQTPECLTDAVDRFEKKQFNPSACRMQAEKFGPEIFRENMKAYLAEKVPDFFKNYQWP